MGLFNDTPMGGRGVIWKEQFSTGTQGKFHQSLNPSHNTPAGNIYLPGATCGGGLKCKYPNSEKATGGSSFRCYYEWNCFWILLPDCSLHVYKNSNWFLYSDLLSCNLMNSFIALMASSRLLGIFGTHEIMSSVKRHALRLPFQPDVFLSFSCLTAQAASSRTMLNGSGDSGHPCLVPHLRGRAVSLSSVWCELGGFTDALCQAEEVPF